MGESPSVAGSYAMLPAANAHYPLPLEQPLRWTAFEGRERVDRAVVTHLIPPGPSRLHGLLQSAHCASLVDALLAAAPALAPAALVASLEVHGKEAFVRLTDGPLRLTVDTAAVALLLQPPAGAPTPSPYPSRWSRIFRTACKSLFPLLPPLMRQHPQLAEAARTEVVPTALAAEETLTLPPFGEGADEDTGEAPPGEGLDEGEDGDDSGDGSALDEHEDVDEDDEDEDEDEDDEDEEA